LFAEGESIFVSEINQKSKIMKNTLLTFGIAGLSALLLSSFALTGNEDNVQKPKKSHHVRMVKIENGKKTEIDTVFTNDNVFVWDGDTINPARQADPGIGRRFGKGETDANVMIFRHRNGEKVEPMFFDDEDDGDMEIISDDNDSTGKKIVVRKMWREEPDDHMIIRNSPGMNHFPPVPPVPPTPPGSNFMKFKHSGHVIDLNDPNVVSYKKKDLKGGLEKIEITRKKTDEREAATFDFQFDGGDFMAPEPPEAPDMSDLNFHSESDSLKMNVIEKKKIVDGKNGKEFEIKVESEKK